ncbi:adaptor protein MecA [Jeotgalibaca ciconiae]|uniref:Adapter protein MecA n=1 Tax=Jeotgalibaca ciconiae TaxID=2496265 RepID=A0A3Q9BLK1_9LACT|nr:adaptor protein MecA [Jeotgalibaca ciconiae]AZP05047.1 adaptor protein MecA [Jeotgalibaca ciconiae]HJB24455.1 adaptor protein MecA [Candidatus Jeotgalibaca pullicola]
MEMENINENTIRVLIENEDLEERGITFLDLLGNQKQIESFFYSILEEVDVDNQFQETDAITFQVLPKGNGLELYISKGDSEDFDTFDGFDPTEQVIDYIKKHTEASDHTTESLAKENEAGNLELMTEFSDFENFVEVAKRLYLESGSSTLYHYNNHYYLSIEFYLDEMAVTDLEDQLMIITEFGEESRLTKEVLSEYGKVIMSEKALETARHYF